VGGGFEDSEDDDAATAVFEVGVTTPVDVD